MHSNLKLGICSSCMTQTPMQPCLFRLGLSCICVIQTPMQPCLFRLSLSCICVIQTPMQPCLFRLSLSCIIHIRVGRWIWWMRYVMGDGTVSTPISPPYVRRTELICSCQQPSLHHYLGVDPIWWNSEIAEVMEGGQNFDHPSLYHYLCINSL